MKKLIIANWKLNPTKIKEAKKILTSLSVRSKNTVVVCPPVIYLPVLSYPRLGAQDCFWEEKGHFTGQVSPLQLKECKVKYCLVGHSEKREVGETDYQVNAKIKALLAHKIIPVLCIGFGTTADEDDMAVVDVLKTQLEADLLGVKASDVIVAYEPVWAISSGDPYLTKKHPTAEHAEKIALFVKTRYGVKTVIYGGSVTSFNAQSYLEQQHIDGLLVGGESLIPSHFNAIINL